MDRQKVSRCCSRGESDRAFVSTRSLVHKHVKVSVAKHIMETTGPHKHVQIARNQIYLPHNYFPIKFHLKSLDISDFTINSS